jgi:hypothetical protein
MTADAAYRLLDPTQIELLRTIGEGGSSTVDLGYLKDKRALVAVKWLKKGANAARLQNEALVSLDLGGKHVVFAEGLIMPRGEACSFGIGG